MTPPQEDICPKQGLDQTSTNWLEPLPPEVETRHRRHTDVSRAQRYDKATTIGDLECTEAQTRIPDWILPLETQENLFLAGHGTAPDLICARGVPDTPSPDPSTIDRKKCNLMLIEVGICQDLGCHKRLHSSRPTHHRPQGGVGKVGICGRPHRPRGHHPQGDATPPRPSPIRHKTRDRAKTS